MSVEDLPIELDDRKGMTVFQLIQELQKIEDKSKYVAGRTLGFGGDIEGITQIKEINVRGYAGSYSFQITEVVLLQ